MSTLSRRSERTPFRKNVLNEISRKRNLNRNTSVQDRTKFPSLKANALTPANSERSHQRSMLPAL